MRYVTLCVALCVTGCVTQPRKTCEPVTVVVERDRKLPEWATDPLPLPVRADTTVGARVRSEAEGRTVIELANCHRALLRRLSNGERVTGHECDSLKGK